MNVFISLAVLLLLATSSFAAGNVKLYGDLEFPDGTMQSTATVQGPVGLQGAKGDTGPQGATGVTGQVTLDSICNAISAGNKELPSFCLAFQNGNGQIDVTVKDSGGAFVSNVRIDVINSVGTIIDTFITTLATTIVTFQETVGSNYSFTFTDAFIPTRFQTQTITATPLLTALVNISAVMLP